MPPTILPVHGLPFTGAGARAEEATVDFLKALPDTYFVLRELRTFPTLEKRQAGATEDRIDLVVIGPAIGVMVLEVKDWNIHRNTFTWIDQYTVRKTDEYGQETYLRNPYAQVSEYYHAVHTILKAQPELATMRVHGFVIFPRLTHEEFVNTFARDIPTQRPHAQERYMLDLQKTIFHDALAAHWDNPLALLTQLVQTQVRTPYEQRDITDVVDVLVPPKLRVGDVSKHESGYERLLLMDEDQQRWAFSEEAMSKNYMLDVAGSGKTNILLSRAMHLVACHAGTINFRVLLLTYSEALTKDLQRLLVNKMRDQSSVDAQRYRQTIVIDHVEHVMEQILEHSLGKAHAEAWRTHTKQICATPDEYLEYKLPEKCQDILEEHGESLRWFDYLLVDEVQDFSDFFLDVAMSLLKNREHVFMVGDVGQKLFKRTHNLGDLGMVEERVRVRGHFRMYRNPKYIAQLAWSFLRMDRFIVQELRAQEYDDAVKSKNTLLTQPVFKFFSTRDEMLEKVYEAIADLVAFRARPEQVLCVGLPETVQALHAMYTSRNTIPACLAKEIRYDERKIVLADFVTSKGLERDYVYILDVDRLPDGHIAEENMFVSTETVEDEARRSRIKIFVALTRAIREVNLYYTDNRSRFINELLSLQRMSRGG